MGSIGVKNKEEIKYSEESIQRALRHNFLSPSSVKYFTENLKIYNWESDTIKFTNSGYVYEFEIKISKTDFKNDFKNKKKNLVMVGVLGLISLRAYTNNTVNICDLNYHNFFEC